MCIRDRLCSPFYNLPEMIKYSTCQLQDVLPLVKPDPLSNARLPIKNKRTWPRLQTILLGEIIHYVSIRDQYRKSCLELDLLNLFKEDIPAQNVHFYFKSLITAGNYYNKILFTNLTFFPEVIKVIPIHAKHNFRRNDIFLQQTSTGGAEALVGAVAGKRALFLYEPWKVNKNQDLKWVVGEIAYLTVIVNNPFQVDVMIELIILAVEGVEIFNYPTSQYLPAGSRNFEIQVKFQPLRAGVMNIKGLSFKCFNLKFFQPLTDRGYSITYYQKNEKLLKQREKANKQHYDIKSINIIEAQPRLKVRLNQLDADRTIWRCTETRTTRLT
eukprot:TRINITY_DN10952_c0_g1_i1.p1 TRINITY_DN10952_c0_g1~~TRINITY_DN10952_c0_g1_i1.p1  ORF type:complete len:343 (-),score=51.75 TRINITY_DN10952_c0_g1_i1:699-1679(-)